MERGVHTALQVVKKELENADIPADMFWIGNKPLTGRLGCSYCGKHGKCQYSDRVNEFLDVSENYDGFVFGTPVHFASAAASMSAFMDHSFFADQFGNRNNFQFKSGTVIVSARRTDTTATIDQLNKYLQYAQMPIVASRYWMVHGQNPEEVMQDAEGLHADFRQKYGLAAGMYRKRQAGGLAQPSAPEPRINTNFIR